MKPIKVMNILNESEDSEKTCCLCGKKYSGWGNSAWPLDDEGYCCDKCNNEKVIPARIAQLYGNKSSDSSKEKEKLNEDGKYDKSSFFDELFTLLSNVGLDTIADGDTVYVIKETEDGTASLAIVFYEGGNNVSDFEVDTIGLGGDTPNDITVLPLAKSGWDIEDGAPKPLKHEDGDQVYAEFKALDETSPAEVAEIIKASFDKPLNEGDFVSGSLRPISDEERELGKEYLKSHTLDDLVDAGKEEFKKLVDKYGFEDAYEIVRQLSLEGADYLSFSDFDDDLSARVPYSSDEFAKSVGNKYNEYTQKINDLKNKFNGELTEDDKSDPILDKTIKVYDIDAFIDKEVNPDSDVQYRAYDFGKDGAAILVKSDGSGCIVDFEGVGSRFDSTSDETTVYICPKDKDEGNGKKSIYLMPTASFKTTIDELLTSPSKEMKVRDFFNKYNYNDRCARNFANLKPYLTECDKKLKEGNYHYIDSANNYEEIGAEYEYNSMANTEVLDMLDDLKRYFTQAEKDAKEIIANATHDPGVGQKDVEMLKFCAEKAQEMIDKMNSTWE